MTKEAQSPNDEEATSQSSSFDHSSFLRALTFDIRHFPHSSSSSNSSSRCSNKRNVLSIGADVVMSTPAAFNVSNGNFEPPERRNPRYASTAPALPESMRCESVTAAEIPVA